MSTYFPDQRFVAKLTIIRRECLLDEQAIGNVQALDGQRVDIRDVVARGYRPAEHVIIEAAEQLNLRNPRNLERMMLAKQGTRVEEGRAIAGRNANRGRRVFAPVTGIIVYVGESDGRIIMQQMPEVINLEAGVRGDVVRVYPGRGVAIEATGALIQGVWGNDRRLIAPLRIEPDEGMASILRDELDLTYKSTILVTGQPLTHQTLVAAQEQNFTGLIAPSMDARLIHEALASELVLILTEGFGAMPMSSEVMSILKDFDGFQITADAYMPRRWEPRRPEIIINQATHDKPPAPNYMMPLRVGSRVRLTRAPYDGQFAKVIDLPDKPVLIDNGLTVPCARVEMITGDKVDIPLANLELAGR